MKFVDTARGPLPHDCTGGRREQPLKKRRCSIGIAWALACLPGTPPECPGALRAAHVVRALLKMGLMGSDSATLTRQGSIRDSHRLLLLFRKAMLSPPASRRPATSGAASGKRRSEACSSSSGAADAWVAGMMS